jgi:prevent-host-death family protein
MRGGREKVAETKVAIGQVKRDISELVNRVAYGGEKIVLTSRGKPKAALVGMGQPLDVDALWQAARADLETRDEHILGH